MAIEIRAYEASDLRTLSSIWFDASLLDLEVYADNRDARAFHARLGFDEISRRDEDDEGLPFANILMRATR
ncbi:MULTISPECIES: hypothetical protein [Burkholderia]|uniref:hypothetical protein n=1 Tax=Burkholderia TaxID=32008 RepID=UPI000B7A2087|nr:MULTISPECIES: hypothetical protein [Burkholderia]MBY4728062.1 hypothetical protein [Burkholderia contaminans]MCI3967911.1 hypothetical protein [Burkholderia sp. HI4860]MDN7791798.1 hypothetical protein [Burkholderia contaminans]OXI97654.1 hypothetical protein CFB48_19460 [Burkholderia sp. AU33647]